MNETRYKFLNNKDILEEIHKSKITYSSYLSDDYVNYDFIVSSIDSVTLERLNQERKHKFDQKYNKIKKEMISNGIKNPIIPLSIEDIKIENIVVRVMTWDHIPANPDLDKLKKAKNESDMHTKVNFPPYQHFIFKDDAWLCVGKSHWQNGIHNGHFSITHGRMTNKLALMFMKLVEKYGYKGNWRSYTYLDEMKSQALVQLSQIGLKFDESRSDIPNPFAYYTAVCNNSFTRILNIEKRSQNIRDDLLIMNNANPSSTRQTEDSIAQQQQFANDEASKKKE